MLTKKITNSVLALFSILSFGCSANNGVTVPNSQTEIISDSSNFTAKAATAPQQAQASKPPVKGTAPQVKPSGSPMPKPPAPSGAGNIAPPPPPPGMGSGKPPEAAPLPKPSGSPKAQPSTGSSGAPAGNMAPPPPPAKPSGSPMPKPSGAAGAPLPQPTSSAPATDVAKFTVMITGGYETNPVDHGRPVVLIASALGVPAEVFRSAFILVTPAAGGQEPDPVQVGLNKDALLSVLAPYGITNDFLDNVSNYYRYSGIQGQVWQRTPATATAVVTNGVVTGINITNPGAGYSSVPTVTIAGVSGVTAKATLAFTKDFKTNGSISAITLQ